MERLTLAREGGGERREHQKGREGLGRGGSFTSIFFSIQSDGIRDVEVVRTAMIPFERDVDTPLALRRHPYYLPPHRLQGERLLPRSKHVDVGGVYP